MWALNEEAGLASNFSTLFRSLVLRKKHAGWLRAPFFKGLCLPSQPLRPSYFSRRSDGPMSGGYVNYVLTLDRSETFASYMHMVTGITQRQLMPGF